MADAGVNARIIEAAVRDRLLTPLEAKKLEAFVAKRNGDLEALLGALMRFHGVAPERAQALVAAAFAAERSSGPAMRPSARLVAPPPPKLPVEPVELPVESAAAPVDELEEVVPEPEDEVVPAPAPAPAATLTPTPAPAPAPGPPTPSADEEIELEPETAGPVTGGAASAARALEALAPPPCATALVPDSPPEPASTELVLFLSPPSGELSPEAAETLARVLGLTVYEARLRARDPLPRVTCVGPEPRVVSTAEELVGAGFEVLCAEAAAVLGPLDAFHVKSIRVGPELVLVDRDGNEATISVARRGLLVVGRYDTTTSVTSQVKTPVVRAKSVALVAKDVSSQGLDSAIFAHVYSELSDVPYVFVETAIPDFAFLGDKKSYTARANMSALVALLASGGFDRDDRLEKHRTRVQQAASFQKQGQTTISSRSSQAAADVLSRVFYHDWKNKLASSS